MRIVRDSSEDEMVAVFLQGEISSERFGPAVREAVLAHAQSEALVSDPDLGDERANGLRRSILATTRGYGENRELFEFFAGDVRWVWARLTRTELAAVRYIEYSYWNEISGGSRLPADAARRINAGVRPWGISNEGFHQAAQALAEGGAFPALIFAGCCPADLVCLEGHLRLTAYALAGFPDELECLVGISPALERWAQ